MTMERPLRVLVAGCGNMGASHARAYHRMPEFEIVGLVSRGPASRRALSTELGGLPEFGDYYEALGTRPDVVSINTYPETHGAYAPARRSRPAATSSARSPWPKASRRRRRSSTRRARERRKLVVGYILRVHPAWIRFIEIARTLGKPLVMRMNLNQQSHGPDVDVAPQPDELDEPDRGLRRPLRGRHVPDDGREAGTRLARSAHASPAS